MTWIVASVVVLGVALVAGFAWYERTHPTARMLALIASLAALAALGRVAFAPLPSVKPTTDIVLIAGFALGGAPGFAVGAVAALASNVFFGQGPWTPWQMVAWGMVGVGGAVLARALAGRIGRWGLAAACGLAGLAFGAIMNLSLWVTFSGDHTADKLVAYAAAGVPFDIAHALGNVAFCLAFGPALLAALRRFRARFEVEWVPLPAPGAAAAAALVVAVLALAAAPPARAATPLEYLRAAQNSDGGFGPGPGQRSTQLHTGWVALGFAARGVNPLDVRRGRRSILDYIEANAREISDLGEIDRTILVLAASGRDPRSFAGRDLVRELVSKRRGNGSFAGRVNTTSFAVFALRAAGRRASDRTVRAAGRWIAGQANADGGFNFARRGGASGVDDTGAALQALAAAGRGRTRTARRAAAFLATRQNRDGGYPLVPGGPSNAQSTAFAVQALVAVGRDPRRQRRNGARDPLAYLRSLTAGSGAVRYSRTSTQTPVWVTAQALTALARTPFPIARVRRARRASAPAPTATPARTAAPAPTPRATAAAEPAPAPARRAPETADLAAQARRAGVLAGLAAVAIL